MPDRGYVPADPAHITWRDRVLSHWQAFVINAMGWGLGLLIVAGVWDEHFDPAPSLAELPRWQALVVGLAMTIGATMWLWAMSRRFEYLEDFWRWQRRGLRSSILGWFAYSVCALSAHTGWVVPWWVGLGMTVAHAGDLYLSHRHQKRVRGLACTKGAPNRA